MKNVIIFLTSLCLFGCSAFPQKKIYTQIDIQAPKHIVWEILEDIQSYEQWNPYHVKVEGKLKVGEKLSLYIHKPNQSKIHIKPHVMDIKPLTTLTWGGGITGIFYGEHVFELDAISETSTRVIQREKFEGLVIPFAELDTIEEGYILVNQALKRRAENNYLLQQQNTKKMEWLFQ